MQKDLKEKNLTNWVNQFADDLLSWAIFKVSDTQLAQDLVQDTFLAASDKIDSFRGESSPKTWLFSILNFKIIDHYRAKARKPASFESQSLSTYFSADGEWIESKKPTAWHEDEGNLLDNEEFNLILKKCMDALPEKWAASIKLKFLINKKGEEICQELGITPSNFWQMIHRAKLQLRDCIENKWNRDN